VAPLAGVLFLRDQRSGVPDVRDATDPAEREKEKRQEPCQVWLHNDDYTPAESVVVILREAFGLGWWKATLTMLKAHATGSALVGVFPEDEARRRVDSAHARAREQGWPLRLSVVPGETR
jgi:ATP-dependent Clp protease adaptor protein ClpS